MGAISGPALYGAARGLGDAEKQGQEAEAFNTDQAIRRERLKNEQELQPLRKRAFEQQDTLGELNIDVTRLTLKERRALEEQAAKARKESDILKGGLREMYASGGDPNHVLKALAQIDPKYGEVTATRTEDSELEPATITFNAPNKQPFSFRKIKDPNTGEMISPEDQVAHFAMKVLDPLEQLKREQTQKEKLQVEGAKTDRATSVATIREIGRAEGRATRAEAQSTRETERRQSGELRRVGPEVRAQLRTTSIPGNFAASYSNDDDAALVGVMESRATENLRQAHKNNDEVATEVTAARSAIEQTRSEFVNFKKPALDAAGKLVTKNINPKDAAALGAAVKGGNADAKALYDALMQIRRRFGDDILNYVVGALPAPKK